MTNIFFLFPEIITKLSIWKPTLLFNFNGATGSTNDTCVWPRNYSQKISNLLLSQMNFSEIIQKELNNRKKYCKNLTKKKIPHRAQNLNINNVNPFGTMSPQLYFRTFLHANSSCIALNSTCIFAGPWSTLWWYFN